MLDDDVSHILVDVRPAVEFEICRLSSSISILKRCICLVCDIGLFFHDTLPMASIIGTVKGGCS